MANGFKTFAVGEVLTAADVNDYLMEQSIAIFANATARDAQITSPIEGQFCYLADSDTLQYYTTSWQNTSLTADITGVTAGDGLSGGGSSGAVTLNVDINSESSATPVTGDEIMIADVSASNAIKKTTLNDLPISSATQTALDNITAGTTAIRTDIVVTVADNGSGSQNEYFLEGAQDMVLNVTTGFKYRFDQSDASNSGHPLRISTTKDGTHASGSAYTDNVTTAGTPGSAGAYTQIEVKADTPERLYIYCTSHAGMGGDTQITAGGFSVDGGTIRGDTDLNDNTLSKVLFKDYAETDVAVTSGTTLAIDLSAGNTGAVTLGHNVTDIDFTNVPTNGTSTFTLKATQDGTGSRTMAINKVTVNGGSEATALTSGNAGITLTTAANSVDLITFLFFDAGNPLVNALLDFKNS
tara:strand:- start:3895 stop:5130 length:1236 start_codon:yes stop_codon:yes gene_type:complete